MAGSICAGGVSISTHGSVHVRRLALALSRENCPLSDTQTTDGLFLKQR